MSEEKKILELLLTMQADMNGIKTEMAGITARLDNLEAGQATMKAGQATMKQELKEEIDHVRETIEVNVDRDLKAMKQELKEEIGHVRAIIEVDVDRDLKALVAGHALLVEQMAKQEDLNDAKEGIHSLLDVMKIVVRQHSDDITELKKAQ